MRRFNRLDLIVSITAGVVMVVLCVGFFMGKRETAKIPAPAPIPLNDAQINASTK